MSPKRGCLGQLDLGEKKEKEKEEEKREALGRELRLGSGPVLWLILLCEAAGRGKSQGYGLRWGEKGKSRVLFLKSAQKEGSWRQFWGPQEKSCCRRMDRDVWSQRCYCCSLSGGLKAVSRVAIETVATLVSAEKPLVCRNCAKGSIKFDITALHFFKWLLLHPNATLFWGYLGLGIFAFKQKNIWFPVGVFFPLILLPLDTSKGKLLRKLFCWFLLFPTSSEKSTWC